MRSLQCVVDGDLYVTNVSVEGYFERNIIAFIRLLGGAFGFIWQKQKKTD